MKIGFAFESRWLDAKDGYYVKVLELYQALKKNNEVVVTDCPFEGANIGYKKRSDFFTFTRNIDALVILVSNLYSDKFTLCNIFKRKKIPIIWILESPVEEMLLLPWFRHRSVFLNKLRLKFLSRFIDVCFCVSNEIKKYAIKDLGIKNALVLPNATNPKIFKKIDPVENVVGKIKNSYIVMWAGAGQFPWQGLDILVSVAKKMEHEKDIVFVIISTLSWFPIPKNLKNVLVLNSVDYENIPTYLNAANVLLCLYKKNFRDNLYNSPMKLFDYMGVGKPIIASPLGQISEIIIDGKNGLLTDNTIDDVCKKILFLKKNPSVAGQLGSQARKDIINTYNWDTVAHKIETKIKFLLEQKNLELQHD